MRSDKRNDDFMIVLACEGICEVQLMQRLLESNSLLFGIKDILDRRPIHLRQPKSIMPLINILPIDEKIVFYRIGDTQKDEFDISCFGQTRRENISVFKVCTKPEIEVLIIINEKLYSDYLKVKSKIAPKQFVKDHLHDYTDFIDYINNHDLLWAIEEYKRIKQNNKDEMYLDDLIKK